MTMRQIFAFAAMLVFLFCEEAWSWTTTKSKQRPSLRQMSLSNHKENFDQPERKINDDCENSRRQWLGSVGAMTASAFGISYALPSYASDVISSTSVCDPTVSVWSKNGRIIYLLGTAHISSTSAALAGQLVRDTNPKGVFIELDPKRVSGSGSLAQKFQGDASTPAPSRDSKIIVPQISESPTNDGTMILASSPVLGEAPPPSKPAKKEGNNPVMKAATAAVGKQIKGLYTRLDSAGFDSGEEFVTAVREGKKLGADIILGDRDVEVTLRRVTEGLARTDLKALLNPDSELEQTLQSMVPVDSRVAERIAGQEQPELSDAEFKQELSSFVETMKTKENVKLIMGQLQRIAPFLYEALVSERDVYMATGLNGLNELESIVAVVGIAHADGIETSLQMNGWKAANPSCPA